MSSLGVGTVLGRYTLGRCIGRGGMGAVYEATHNDLKKPVAIKILDPRLVHDPELGARFIREGEAAARIRHPHVVDIYDVGREGEISYLVMELLVGEDLGAVLQRSRRLTIEATVEFLIPVCAALVAAHRGGVIHRDLKPGNIFLADGAHGVVPKVLDFGISKTADAPRQGLTLTGALMGTPHYMSPEQARGGQQIDHRTDIYSVGVVLYQCMTGRVPIDAESTYLVLNKIVEGQFDPPSQRLPDLDPNFEQVILRAMAKDASARYPSMAALGGALIPFAGPRVQTLWAPAFADTATEGAASIAIEAAYREPLTPAAVVAATIEAEPDAPLAEGEPSRSGRWIAVLAVVAALLGGLAAFAALVFREVPAEPIVRVVTPPPAVEDVPAPPPIALPPKPTYKVSITASPKWAQIMIDGKVVSRGYYETNLARDGRTHDLVVRARGFYKHTSTFTDGTPPLEIALKTRPIVSIRDVSVFNSTTAQANPQAKAGAGRTKAAGAGKAASSANRSRSVATKATATSTVSPGQDNAQLAGTRSAASTSSVTARP